MKEIQIIGDKIYYDDILVAKLVESSMHTVQGEFVDEMKSINERLEFEEYEDDEDA